ncbi:MAG: hypothetical protein OCD01_05285 [Fibrobacterales bacterium]
MRIIFLVLTLSSYLFSSTPTEDSINSVNFSFAKTYTSNLIQIDSSISELKSFSDNSYDYKLIKKKLRKLADLYMGTVAGSFKEYEDEDNDMIVKIVEDNFEMLDLLYKTTIQAIMYLNSNKNNLKAKKFLSGYFKRSNKTLSLFKSTIYGVVTLIIKPRQGNGKIVLSINASQTNTLKTILSTRLSALQIKNLDIFSSTRSAIRKLNDILNLEPVDLPHYEL